MKTPLDLIGQKFGKLTVLKQNGKYTYKGRTYIHWDCQCDCGKIVNVRGSNLKSKSTKSCGCVIPHRKSFSESNFNYIFYTYKRNARLKKREFSLTKEEFKILTSSKCYYCNQQPQTITKNQNTSNGYYKYNGIDRVDNSKGYSIDNCVSCCKRCNFSKHNLSKTEFLNIVKMIYERHFK